MKIRGNEVLWESENKNVAVAYSQFDMGDKYKIHRVKNGVWRFVISFGTLGEAVEYAKKIFDVPVDDVDL